MNKREFHQQAVLNALRAGQTGHQAINYADVATKALFADDKSEDDWVKFDPRNMIEGGMYACIIFEESDDEENEELDRYFDLMTWRRGGFNYHGDTSNMCKPDFIKFIGMEAAAPVVSPK